MKFTTYIFISCFLCFFSSSLFCQTREDKIREINSFYARVEQGVDYGEFFVNEINANATRLSLHHPGYYQHAQRYFYRITKEHPVPVLLLVAVRTEEKKIEYYREYLYDLEGNLQFYYEKQNDSSKLPYEQMRIYFYRNHIVQVLHDKDEFRGWESDVFPKAEEVLESATKYYEKFHAQMADIGSIRW